MDEPFDFGIEADKLMIGCAFLADLDLEGIINAVARADTIGPIVDPTRYQQALVGGGMHAAARLADLAADLVAEHETILEKATKPR